MAGVNAQMDTTSKSNIVLIGMPGVGKSTVGVVLAKILNFQFLDVDLLIQQTYDDTLQNLIDNKGSEEFISLENNILSSINTSRTVVSTGGSAIYSEGGMNHLKQVGRVVYLKAALETISARLGDFSDRGIVARSLLSTLAELYAERMPLYDLYADVVIDVDDLNITEAARAIIDALEA